MKGAPFFSAVFCRRHEFSCCAVRSAEARLCSGELPLAEPPEAAAGPIPARFSHSLRLCCCRLLPSAAAISVRFTPRDPTASPTSRPVPPPQAEPARQFAPAAVRHAQRSAAQLTGAVPTAAGQRSSAVTAVCGRLQCRVPPPRGARAPPAAEHQPRAVGRRRRRRRRRSRSGPAAGSVPPRRPGVVATAEPWPVPPRGAEAKVSARRDEVGWGVRRRRGAEGSGGSDGAVRGRRGADGAGWSLRPTLRVSPHPAGLKS